jgi:hypothetical protein
MCNPWKTIFTLVPLAPLTMISPMMNSIQINLHAISFKMKFNFHIEINSFFSIIDELIFAGGAQEDGAEV